MVEPVDETLVVRHLRQRAADQGLQAVQSIALVAGHARVIDRLQCTDVEARRRP